VFYFASCHGKITRDITKFRENKRSSRILFFSKFRNNFKYIYRIIYRSSCNNVCIYLCEIVIHTFSLSICKPFKAEKGFTSDKVIEAQKRVKRWSRGNKKTKQESSVQWCLAHKLYTVLMIETAEYSSSNTLHSHFLMFPNGFVPMLLYLTHTYAQHKIFFYYFQLEKKKKKKKKKNNI